MCGIAGILSGPFPDAGSSRSRLAQARLRAMARALAHRGPDGEGFFSDAAGMHLGHRRLAILDPSERGAQPMTDPSGRYTLSFNGAIYNFVELHKELASLPGSLPLRGSSDTEVLLHAWAAWGPASLQRLNGMFAFALWDAGERTLFLCRDRFGVKPLYYAWLGPGAPGGDDTRLLFASEVKALFVHPALRPLPDARALAEFLSAHDIDHREEHSLFCGVQQVPPASYLRVAAGPVDGASAPPRLCRYWQVAPAPDAERQPLSPELVERTRELLFDAVALRLRSDVPLGGTLSGGLDSSLLTGIVAGPLYRLGRLSRLQVPYRVFLSRFPGLAEGRVGDESPWADKVLGFLPREAVLPLYSTPADLGEDLRQVLYHQEEPFADSSICAHYALMRVVRDSGVKVVLTGQGADEIFGGYPPYYYALLGELLRRRRPLLALRQARARARVFGEPLRRLLLGGVYHAVPAPLRERLYRRRMAGSYPLSRGAQDLLGQGEPRFAEPRRPFLSGRAVLDAQLLACIRRWALPHILRQDDRNAMAFGVESRAPYLDFRLAELAFRTQPEARLADGYTKVLLREVAAGLLPEDVRLRPDKIGFFSPRRDWLLASEALVRDATVPMPAEIAALTDEGEFRKALDAFFRHKDYRTTDRIWGGFLCSLWARDTLPRMAALRVTS